MEFVTIYPSPVQPQYNIMIHHESPQNPYEITRTSHEITVLRSSIGPPGTTRPSARAARLRAKPRWFAVRRWSRAKMGNDQLETEMLGIMFFHHDKLGFNYGAKRLETIQKSSGSENHLWNFMKLEMCKLPTSAFTDVISFPSILPTSSDIWTNGRPLKTGRRDHWQSHCGSCPVYGVGIQRSWAMVAPVGWWWDQYHRTTWWGPRDN